MAGPDARSRFAAAGSGTRFADVRWWAELDSTNREALDRAGEGAPEGLVVVADHQTAGRGRLGRRWEAPPGSSLLASILLRPPAAAVSPDRLHLLTVAAGLAAAEACDRALGFAPRLKWPNDLVVADAAAAWERKLGGILAESLVRGGEVAAVVVGIGINVRWPEELPAEIAETAISADRVAGRRAVDTDPDPVGERAALLAALLAALDRRYGDVLAGEPSILLADYRERCATLGRDVRVDLAGGATFSGRATEIAPDGGLVVRPDDGGAERVVRAADVVHLRPA